MIARALLLLSTLFVVSESLHEVGMWRVGANCRFKDDVRHPNYKRVTVEFLEAGFSRASLPVVLATVIKPNTTKAEKHFFSVNAVDVTRGGFVAQVRRIDVPQNPIDVGWCYNDLDISWMAYAPAE
eukprot:c3649_g1_i1.p1 GENE.c3649_g1_i1~~c3649_g1_i1.p1  ORF type:complete len:126 (-),score=22.57 c3649_g1_i1:52-429(-)